MENGMSLEDAIYYASQQAREMGANESEYISLVYRRPDGSYGFVKPQGGKSDSHVRQKLGYPKGAVLEALVHNHPGIDEGGYEEEHAMFSPDDIRMSKQMRIPSYISYGKDMSIKRYDPSMLMNKYGKPFNHIPEVQPAGQRLGPPPTEEVVDVPPPPPPNLELGSRLKVLIRRAKARNRGLV